MANNFKTLNSRGLDPTKIPHQFDAALFIDNDITHVRKVSECSDKMDTIKVGEEPKLEEKPWATIVPFTEKVSRNTHGKAALNFFKTVRRLNKLAYDAQSGIQKDHCDAIKEWVLKNHNEGNRKLAVLFDYDRTLTVIEGTYFSDFPTSDKEGFLQFFMGGKERLDMLRELFEYLEDNDVAMYILTNNTACGNPDYNFGILFEQVIDELFEHRDVHIICGRDRRFSYNKKAAVQAQQEFQTICPKPNTHEDEITRVFGLSNEEAEKEWALLQGNNQDGGKRKTRRRHKKRKTQKRKSKTRS